MEFPLFQGNLGWWNIIPFGQIYLLIIRSWKEDRPLPQVDTSKLPFSIFEVVQGLFRKQSPWESHANLDHRDQRPYRRRFNFTTLRYFERQTCSATSAENFWDLRAAKNCRTCPIGADVCYFSSSRVIFLFETMPSMNCWDGVRTVWCHVSQGLNSLYWGWPCHL